MLIRFSDQKVKGLGHSRCRHNRRRQPVEFHLVDTNRRTLLVCCQVTIAEQSVVYTYYECMILLLLLIPPVGSGVLQSACLCVSVREHISGVWNRWNDLRELFVLIPCGRGSVLLWRRCDTLSTSGFMDDFTFGRSGPYGDAWKAEPSAYYH